MLYRKIRISHLDNKKLLYRVLYVPDNTSLMSLAAIIRCTFRMDEGHLYEFRKGRITYACEHMLSEDYGDFNMSMFNIHHPGDTYQFTYDYGDQWDFEVRVYKAAKEFDGDYPAVVQEGKGLGIWEDNRSGYLSLLDGEMPADLSEDDEERGFYMPWNLQLEHASDTFGDIDPEGETEYLSSMLSGHEDIEDDSENVWASFNEAYMKALDAFMYMEDENALWIDAWEKFRNTCAALKEENELPDTFAAVIEKYPEFDGDEFIMDLADELIDEREFEKLIQITDELQGMFEPDGETEAEIIRAKAESLHGLKRDGEMLAYTQQMYGKYPKNYAVMGVLLDAYRHNRKKKDGRQLLEDLLKNEPECTEENYPFYIAAYQFARYAGLKALAKKMETSIDEEDSRQSKELEEETAWHGEFDEEYDDEEDDFYDAQIIRFYTEQLSRAVREYKYEASGDSFADIGMALGMLMSEGGFLFVTGDAKGSTESRVQLKMIVDEDKDQYFLPLYTEDTGKLPDDVTLYHVPVEDMFRFVVNEKLDGIVLDAYPDDEYTMTLPLSAVESLLRLVEKAGLISSDEDFEPDEDFGDMIDDSELPF